MKTIFFRNMTMTVASFLIIISCTKQDSSPTQAEDLFKQAEKEAVAEAVLQKADDQINKEISMLENLNYIVPATKSEDAGECNPKITIETPPNSKFPKTITLDYGTGCTDKDGNFRAGKIIVHITGAYWEPKTVRQSKLVNYCYNDLKIEGSRHEINKGANDKGYIVFDVKHDEKIWTKKGELVVDRSWTKVRTCNRGADLKSNLDDEMWVTGSAKVEKNGIETIKEITVPLYKKQTCMHFQSGVITTFIKKEKVAQFNYGDGKCDDVASWSNGKVTKEVTLKTGINYYAIKP